MVAVGGRDSRSDDKKDKRERLRSCQIAGYKARVNQAEQVWSDLQKETAPDESIYLVWSNGLMRPE
jgi:hypothetical protein